MGMSVEYTITELEGRAESCEVCALFLKVTRSHLDPVPNKVRFDRRDSYIDLNNTGIEAIQLLRDPYSTPWRDVKPGLPNVPNTSREVHFETIRQWLRLCDDEGLHPHCRAAKTKPGQMPTRLIDVGTDENQAIRVWEPGKDDVSEYVALSHPWGDPPHFVSTTENIDQHRRNINLDKLPATFRDAILTTRAIGKRYLWIDSICILQGPGGDFHVEAGRMEAVFSSAYCVLAASRAHNQMDGFLGPRRERDYVAMRDKHRNANFFLCENIDAFDRHVLGGHLHKRGWVLQEHALARRTIFFTEHQTYWECGDGVRCETLTKMTNNLAAFLGDPKFPRIIMSASQGEKIIRFQNLYKTYSSLLFTNPTDRPIAVSGIQRRLLEAFGTRGGYGVFDEDVKTGQLGLLRRSLLWHRAVDGERNSRLSRIEFSVTERTNSAAPPSWSWMAYIGEISFLKLDFGAIDWIKIRSPWGAEDGQTTTRFADGRRNLALKAPARIISASPADVRGAGKLYFDDFARTEGKDMPCVVLGTDKQKTAIDEKVHYFILIEPDASSGLGPSKTYKRVGAGYLPGKYLGREVGWVDIY